MFYCSNFIFSYRNNDIRELQQVTRKKYYVHYKVLYYFINIFWDILIFITFTIKSNIQLHILLFEYSYILIKNTIVFLTSIEMEIDSSSFTMICRNKWFDILKNLM